MLRPARLRSRLCPRCRPFFFFENVSPSASSLHRIICAPNSPPAPHSRKFPDAFPSRRCSTPFSGKPHVTFFFFFLPGRGLRGHLFPSCSRTISLHCILFLCSGKCCTTVRPGVNPVGTRMTCSSPLFSFPHLLFIRFPPSPPLRRLKCHSSPSNPRKAASAVRPPPVHCLCTFCFFPPIL